MKRLFLALRPDHEASLAIQAIIKRLQPMSLRPYKISNLHVTLVFLGNVDAATESSIRQAMVEVVCRAFTVEFDCLSYWRKPKVLCLTCSQQVPEALWALQQDLNVIAQSCGLVTDPRPFQPHITIARKVGFKPGLSVDQIIWHAREFCLVESVDCDQGVAYRTLDCWALIKKGGFNS
jgi:2'-5' RNA ligase